MVNNYNTTNNNIHRHPSLSKEGEGKSTHGMQDSLLRKESWGGSLSYADPSLYDLLKQYARENRKNMTEAESILWRYIRRNALGVTFLLQFIIGE